MGVTSSVTSSINSACSACSCKLAVLALQFPWGHGNSLLKITCEVTPTCGAYNHLCDFICSMVLTPLLPLYTRRNHILLWWCSQHVLYDTRVCVCVRGYIKTIQRSLHAWLMLEVKLSHYPSCMMKMMSCTVVLLFLFLATAPSISERLELAICIRM